MQRHEERNPLERRNYVFAAYCMFGSLKQFKCTQRHKERNPLERRNYVFSFDFWLDFFLCA